jgi:hypothetical protein
MKKTYTCEQWPSLHLGWIRFRDGRYVTSDPDEQSLIEHSQSFGAQIQLVDSDDAGEEQSFVEPPAESAEEEPPRRPGRPAGSGARQGTTGTGNLR